MKDTRIYSLPRSSALFVGVALIAACAASAKAGPNANGALVIHAAPQITYSSDGQPCDSAFVDSCSDLVIDTEPRDNLVVYVTAAFPASSSPSLAGVTFALQYNSTDLTITDWGACADFEISDSSWPTPGAGTAVTWNVPRVGDFTPVYWFLVSVPPGTIETLEVVPHPTQGAYFADGATPSILDPIQCLGALGFNDVGSPCCTAAGSNEPIPLAAVPTIRIDPNPARSTSVITISALYDEPTEIRLITIAGREVGRANLGGNFPRAISLRNLARTDLPRGAYVLRAQSRSGCAVSKFMKEEPR